MRYLQKATSLSALSLKKTMKKISYLWEYLLSLGGYSEIFLVNCLLRIYRGKFKMQWLLGKQVPHFEDQRIDISYFAFGKEIVGPYSFSRGFFSSEIIKPGDTLLDIGCGDGFFTRRFFAERCAHIDGIDLEPSAIQAAKRYNNAPNIKFHTMDAVTQPFPENKYNVVVWDGAIGHFSADATEKIIQKIRNALSNDGIFVGSESLGKEGSDHLQYFNSLDDLGALFTPYFKYVEMRTINYKIIHGNFIRQEAYWRCSNDLERLSLAHWKILESA